MFRQAVARAPRALARRSPAGANRQAHDLAHQLEHYNPAATGSFDAFGVKEIKDSRIAHGERAFVWEIPKDLKPNAFIKRRKAVEEHAFSTTELWRRITFYVCCPALVATGIYVYKAEMAHKAHYAELVAANGGKPPERKPYAFLNVRNKPFPWGNQSLFFNPYYNTPVPEE